MTPDVSVVRGLADLVARAPLTPSVLDDEDRVQTAQDLLAGAGHLAAQLADHGVVAGDRVAWAGRNDPRLLTTMLAAQLLRAVFVPLNFRLTTAEARLTLEHCTPRVVVVEPELEPVYGPLAGLPAVGAWLPAERCTVTSPSSPAVDPSCRPDDAAVIVYTSGSSGRPKGVVLTHANLWWSARSMGAVCAPSAGDLTLVVAPLFHIAGLNCLTLETLRVGGTLAIRRTFDPARTLADLTTRTSFVFGVPAMYAAVARTAGFATADLSGVRAAVVGGAAIRPDTLAALVERGLALMPSWGMTELAGGATASTPADAAAAPCSVGTPLPYLEVSLRDVCGGAGEGGTAVTEPGVVGEVWVRGPQVTPGYWADAAATSAALTPDGWLRTGDLAVRDGVGRLTLVGRTNELINTGGEKVVPGEVEAALRGLAVDDLVVVGAPDATWGETVVAVLACGPGAAPTLDDVRRAAGASLARYKLPTRLVVVADLPRTGSGKVDRTAVRTLAAAAR